MLFKQVKITAFLFKCVKESITKREQLCVTYKNISPINFKFMGLGA